MLESQAWLGEAVAIKDPTAAVFRPQSGSNLLIVGQNDEAALGILATSLLSLAAQHSSGEALGPGHRARFYVVEPGAGEEGKDSLAMIAALLPHKTRLGSRRELPSMIAELAEEVERRQSDFEGENPPLYLIVCDLARFRDLRRQENEFSFSMDAEAGVSTAKQFSTILREGPVLGVHTILWCDTLNNLNRTFDRQTLREFDMRVLFQMSGSDSSHLIDLPLAAKLGPHLALYHNEDEGRLEKFRPYSFPSGEWLTWVARQLRSDSLVEPFDHLTR